MHSVCISIPRWLGKNIDAASWHILALRNLKYHHRKCRKFSNLASKARCAAGMFMVVSAVMAASHGASGIKVPRNIAVINSVCHTQYAFEVVEIVEAFICFL